MKQILWSLAVVAITAVSSSAAIAQSSSAASRFPVLQGITLTATQQQQLTALSDQVIADIEKVLDPSQEAQLRQALANGTDIRSTVSGLNLTADQQGQTQQILQSAQGSITQILTPEQKQQLQQNARRLRVRGF
ncbi:MAG: hypothetical protein HC919_00010 [Oscillatoriales cyanobacterium SM2_2_1]|nr:hypothetical protein [Oscillatoriales cyanobacterium SM2_2_1]